MKPVATFISLALCCAVNAQDPVEHLKQASGLQRIDPARLLTGDFISERGALGDFPNGISAQFCFATALPPAETAHRLQVWDPTPYPALEVYQFHSLTNPCRPEDFRQLEFKANLRPMRWLQDKLATTTGTKSDLNLTGAEAKQLADCIQKRNDPRVVADCFIKMLVERASLFQKKGLAGALPYELSGNPVSPAIQLRMMVREQSSVATEFAPLLKKIGLHGNTADLALQPFHYWSLFQADRHATLNLGAVYLLQDGERYLLADVQYYVSSGFYTSITLTEIVPFRNGDKTGSLCWRVDYLAAPMLHFTKGTDRLAFGALMVQDIKKSIGLFLDEVKPK